ncbi:branched-chain-amino-acid aminotransferase-like protein 2 [Patiria miniata]|uniref:Sulfotransferase family protein n=1 Tax=Patiria miniata TaxID=46514 RepID=A0A914B6M6_PATMI|nr:branched-chain-amino-acid aminotransferase-like protein 2 [Patiria miniata]
MATQARADSPRRMAWEKGNDKPAAKVMLWSAPRSLSTVFERSIIALETSDVYNEMYTAAYLFGPERLWLKKIPSLAPTLSHAKVTKKLNTASQKSYTASVLFAKDFAFAVQGHFDELPEDFMHTFLIRNPVKVFTSLKPRLEASRLSKMVVGTSILGCIPAEGYTIKELYDLFEYMEHKTRKTPIVIDADDLLSDPEGMMRQYCSVTGIPYDEKMLRWKPAKASELRWHCPRVLRVSNLMMGWYNAALGSSGFRKPTPKKIDVNELPAELREAIDFTTPYYQAMYKIRLRPEKQDSTD